MKRLPLAILHSFLFCATLAFAQTDAMVSGNVTDPSGGNVVNVAVTAFNTGSGISTKATTNHAGVYVFAALPPGNYRVSAEHADFRKAVINDVILEVGARVTLNLSLQLG